MNTLTLKTTSSLCNLDELELANVEGGAAPLIPPAVALAGVVFAGTVAVAAGLATVAAVGYAIGKDIAENRNDDCECPAT